MANQNPQSKTIYWFESASSSIIKAKVNVSIGQQNYWYNGNCSGFLTFSRGSAKPRNYSILIGFN
jgi:hypothetical protein